MSIQCRITRGGYTESLHSVFAVVVGKDGTVLYSAGDPDYVTCIRSSLKPFQAAAAVSAGAVDAAGFDERELALMCASHNGEDIHVETARSMIRKLGFTAHHYECGSHYPYDQDTRIGLYRRDRKSSPYHNNCSGKHAGMLCLAKHLKAEPRGYTNRDHPVQRTIMKQLKAYTGLKDILCGIDGCSAPTPFLSLKDIAGLFQKLADGRTHELERVYTAMTRNPYLVAGKKRFDTDFIEALQGRGVTKVGGEAVRGVGIRRSDGTVLGLALKVLDGNQRCLPGATMSLLQYMNLLKRPELEALGKYRSKKIINHRNIHVGTIETEMGT